MKVLILLCSILCVAYAAAEPVFISSTKERSIQVELFEFDSPEQQSRAIALAKTLRCPQCQNQNLIESNSPIAKDLRLNVFEMIKDGKSDEYIIEYMTERFGEYVLYNPPLNRGNLVLWLIPFVIFVLFVHLAIKSVKRDV